MGLDMYLYAVNKVAGDSVGKIESDRLYLDDDEASKRAQEMQERGEDLYSLEEYDKPHPKPGRWYHADGVMQVAYWRKANAVHDWFVHEVQNGEDECEPHIVHPEKLADLYQRCKTVIEDPSQADTLLPTRGGFFFGSTAYDDWYVNDLKETVAMLDAMRDDPRCHGKTLVYVSSW